VARTEQHQALKQLQVVHEEQKLVAEELHKELVLLNEQLKL
jgi:hypothetical protein